MKSLLAKVLFKSAQIRGEDLGDAVILNRNIILKLIHCLTEEQLKTAMIELNLPPISSEGPEFGEWLEANRRILKLNQFTYGSLVGATQAEISRLEGNKSLGGFGRARISDIIKITLQKIGSLRM